MRFLTSLSFVVVGVVVGGCPAEPLRECEVAVDCGVNAACVEGVCTAITPIPVVSEGEGDAAEGEGDGISKGEGEGDVVVGEGEGDIVVVGEGEGDVVAEGEGEVGLCAGVSCRAFQDCDAGSGDCEYVGTVCDAFQHFSLSTFASTTTPIALDVDGGSNVYEHFSPARPAGDYLLDAWALNSTAIDEVASLIAVDSSSPPAAAVRIDVAATGFDPFVGVLDDGGVCSLVDSNDDFPTGDGSHSRVDLDVRDLSGSTNVVVSTFLQNTSGTYLLRTRPVLCGEEVDSVETFNRCGRALSTTTNTCAGNNPCERDDFGATTGRACCISTGSTSATTANACGRKAGEEIFTFATPPGVCGG